MLTFKKIRYKNFLATGNAWNEVNLVSHTNTLIIGENGAGKSTVLDALCFALYGKAMRAVNKPTLINSVNQKDCLVEIEFHTPEHAYKVVRGIKPNVFDIYMDGKLIPELPSMAEQQEYLENYILKCNYKAFTQVVILGAASYVPFMRLTPSARREILEELLDIEVFTTMQSLLKDKFSAHKDVLNDITKRIAVLDSQHELAAKYNEQWAERQAVRRGELEGQVALRQKDLGVLADNIRQYTERIAHCDVVLAPRAELDEKLLKAQKVYDRMESEQYQIEEQIRFFNSTDQCTRCNQPISTDTRDRHAKELAERETQIAADMAKVNTAAQRLTQKREALMRTLNERRGFEVEVQRWTAQTAAVEKELDRLAGEIEKTHEAPPPPPTDLGDPTLLVEEQEAAMYQRYIMEQAALLLKDKGIRTRVIQQYLPMINKTVNEYLSALNFSIQFTLDDQFNETIKSRHRDTFSYESFSEGEKKRIDLALLLTWRAVARMKNSVNTNLLIFDEILDSSLDAAGADDFLRIIHAMDPDTNVLVISHRTDQMLDKFARVLHVRKARGFSSIRVAA